MLFLGEYLEKIIPLVVKFCNVDDDELREYCIQAFESFVRRQVLKIPIFQIFFLKNRIIRSRFGGWGKMDYFTHSWIEFWISDVLIKF